MIVTYNQNGTSRGIASIIFAKADTAAKAAKELNGLLVDGRPMKVRNVVWFSKRKTPIDSLSRSKSSSMLLTRPPFPPPSRSLSVSRKPMHLRSLQPNRLQFGSQKSQPKPATGAKPAANARGRTRATRGARKGRNVGRGKPKTVEELDAEMVDYFTNENAPADGNATNGAPQQTNGDQDLGMAEISVCSTPYQSYDMTSNRCTVNSRNV